MSNSEYTRDVFAAAYASEAQWVSWHYDDPGATGENEFAGLPRQALAWTGPENGKVVAAPITQSAWSPGDFMTHLGFWTAQTGGEFVNSAPYDAQYPGGGSDTYNISYEHPE